METFKLSKLQVTNFRNLQSDVIDFSSHINCILGENGNGKTNILEAVHVLTTKKSFRKNSGFPQYLGIDGEETKIIFSSIFNNDKGEQYSYSGKISENGGDWFLNGKATRKKLDIPIVFINPFDSYGFHHTSSFRRQWIDSHLSLLDSTYKKNLKKYNASLRFRNKLLSTKPYNYREQIKANDSQLARYSQGLVEKRKIFLKELSPYCENAFREIFSRAEQLEVNMDSRVLGLNEAQIYQMLQSRLEKDEIVGHTTYGVHKDDYVLLFNGLNSYDYCSLGQQKMSYLSMLFAYIKLFRYKYSYPIVLMDDVSGELDKARWKNLVDYLERQDFQILITTANENFKEELDRIEKVNKIYVKNGSIKNIKNQ